MSITNDTLRDNVHLVTTKEIFFNTLISPQRICSNLHFLIKYTVYHTFNRITRSCFLFEFDEKNIAKHHQFQLKAPISLIWLARSVGKLLYIVRIPFDLQHNINRTLGSCALPCFTNNQRRQIGVHKRLNCSRSK